jgi:hypothetical protein
MTTASLAPKNLWELFWQGKNGIDVKNGQVEPQGFVSGHTDHVHIAAQHSTVVAVGKAAQRFGLHVGENPAFGTVHPVHVSGSYHYRGDATGQGEAIDVSGTPDKMAAFAHFVARNFGVERNAHAGATASANAGSGGGGLGLGAISIASDGAQGIVTLGGDVAGAILGGPSPVHPGSAADQAAKTVPNVVGDIVSTLGTYGAKLLLYVVLILGGAALVIAGAAKTVGIQPSSIVKTGAKAAAVI